MEVIRSCKFPDSSPRHASIYPPDLPPVDLVPGARRDGTDQSVQLHRVHPGRHHRLWRRQDRSVWNTLYSGY